MVSALHKKKNYSSDESPNASLEDNNTPRQDKNSKATGCTLEDIENNAKPLESDVYNSI